MSLRDAAKEALACLESVFGHADAIYNPEAIRAMTALRAALASDAAPTGRRLLPSDVGVCSACRTVVPVHNWPDHAARCPADAAHGVERASQEPKTHLTPTPAMRAALEEATRCMRHSPEPAPAAHGGDRACAERWTIDPWTRIDKEIVIRGPGTLVLRLDHDDVDLDDVEGRLPGIVAALNREPPFPGAAPSPEAEGPVNVKCLVCEKGLATRFVYDAEGFGWAVCETCVVEGCAPGRSGGKP